MKGGTLTLMVFATAVPLLITASVLLVSYGSSCTLANYGEVQLPASNDDDWWRRGSDGAGSGIRPKSRILSKCRRRWRMQHGQTQTPSGGTGVMEEPLGGGRTSSSREQATYSDVRYNQVRGMQIEEQDARDLLQASRKLDLTDPRTGLLLKLVKWYTRGWEPVQERVPGGDVRIRSVWSVRDLRDALSNNSIMACCVHVRVVEGKVYFRYGLQSLTVQYRLDRANDVFSFLQATIDKFELRDVRVEFLLNTCDHALSREGTAQGHRSNYLVWTPHVTETMDSDLVVPDLLDLRPQYMRSRQDMEELRRAGPEWKHKIPKAVFRGATTNYWLKLSNWVSSPRLRLHRMTEGLGDMLDARVTRWSHAPRDSVQDIEDNGGIFLGDTMNDTQKNEFKYEMIVDGGMGGGRLCGVLLTERALIMQDSPFIQFFYPLMKKGLHFFETDHYFRNLPELLKHMQSHDDQVRQVVDRVHQELGWTCSIQGRMLAFAVLLVKYHSLQDPSLYRTGSPDPEHLKLVQVPSGTQICQWGPAIHNVYYRSIPFDHSKECPYRAKPRVIEMPGCPTDCSQGLLERDWRWLSADDLEGVQGMDWWKTYIPET